MKLFKTFNNSILQQVQYYSGYLPLAYIIDLHKLTFYYDLCYIDNSPASTLFKWCGWEEMVSLQQSYAIPEGTPKGSVKRFFEKSFILNVRKHTLLTLYYNI